MEESKLKLWKYMKNKMKIFSKQTRQLLQKNQSRRYIKMNKKLFKRNKMKRRRKKEKNKNIVIL